MSDQERINFSVLVAEQMAKTARTDPSVDAKIIAAEMMAHGYSILAGVPIDEARGGVNKMFSAAIREEARGEKLN